MIYKICTAWATNSTNSCSLPCFDSVWNKFLKEPGGQDSESLPQVTLAEGCHPGHLRKCSLDNHGQTKQNQKERAALSKFSADHFLVVRVSLVFFT